MELDKSGKTKTYFVIIVFIVIILLSAYVVIDKIIKRNEEDLKLNNLNKTTSSVLKDSSLITELSLTNKYINELYNYINDKDIEYVLYSDKNKELSWDIKSLMISKSILNKKTEESEIMYIDKESFESMYSKLFNDDIDKLSIEDKTAFVCGGASYDFENDIYVVKSNCSLDNNMKSFFKNIIYEDDSILINKYYIFTEKHLSNGVEEYDLYKSNKTDEDNLLVTDIKMEDINNYISDMNVMTFKFSKSKDGKYYFDGIK